MGVVNTTYTFTGTDTITSSKLNNIIDDTTFTSDAILPSSALEIVSPGKLAVKAGGITSNELASDSVVTAKIADASITTLKITDANVTQSKLASNVVGTGPAFRASASGTTTLSGVTMINLAVENFDTNNNFSSNRFTPTIAGYYFITGAIEISGGGQNVQVSIYKNNVKATSGIQVSGLSYNSVCSDIIYMNGTTDYLELFGVSSPDSTVAASGTGTYMSGCLIRSA